MHTPTLDTYPLSLHDALPISSVVTIDATGGSGSSGSDTGTGFVFDKQGHILTNNHVVANAANGGKLTATFSNGKQYTAKIDRKSTRLNSSHLGISYAVFCLKK